MQHKLLTLLLIVFGVVAVLGRSQIRFMNARFYSGLTVDITTDIYSTNQTSLAVNSRYSDYTDIIPTTDYLQLPTPSIPEDYYVTFYAYNKDDLTIPVNVLANVSVGPLHFQSHTLVYVDQSDNSWAQVTDVPAQLFIFEEMLSQPGSFLKIVNVAVASYPYGGFTVRVDRYGDVYVPYGSDSGFLAIAPGPLNVTAFLPGTTKSLYFDLHNLTTTLYIRGDIAEATYFGYNLVEHDSSEYWSFVPMSQPPVVAPTSAPVYQSAPVASGSSVTLVKFINTYSLGLYAFAMFDQWHHAVTNVTTRDIDTGYQTVYAPGNYMLSISNYDFAGGVDAYLQAGRRYSFYFGNYIGWNVLEDDPIGYNNYNQSYLRLVNTVPGTTFLELYTPNRGWNTWYSSYGEVWYPQFLTESIGYGELYITTDNQTNFESFFLDAGTTTIYLYGTQENVSVYFDEQPLAGPTEPVCVNGYVESNGVCNCYSGYTSDGSPYKCATAAPYYCFRNQTDALSNDYVPYIPYWSAQVYGNQLSFSVYSDIVANRRTLVELPNPQCSFINSPQYYQQYNNGCQDRLDVNIPFTDCGFTKTSSSTEDVYKGTVHVKQIDRVTVAGTTYDRVIDTPMPIAIRMPKTLAVQSYVQVFGPPSLAIDAAFVGQTVSTETQSGNLQYVSSVQYPLQIEAVQLVDLPYGVDAWIEVVNVNCSGVGPCVQRLDIHLNTSSCSISGVYRMVVSLSCRTDQGCPDEAKNGTQVYIESRIVSQSLCGEMSVDIDLNGYIQAFTDQDFTNPALAFYPGQSAYFLISAYSSRVSLSKVSIESVYYYGPNINYQYLSYNTSLSSIAVANNFTTGTQGNSQAWFGLDVSVSTPNSGDNSTLFKLYQGQNGVYNFVAIVDVEWYVANNAPTVAPYYPYQPTSTATPTAALPGPPIPAQPVAYAPTYQPTSTASPVGQSTPSRAPIPPPTPVAYPPTNPPLAKKRMVLQGAVSNQGSQFTAQVQVAGPTPSSQQPQQQPQPQQTPVTANPGTTDNKPVSSGVSLSSSLFVIAVALVALF